MEGFVKVAMGFGIAVVGLVIVVILMNNMLTSPAGSGFCTNSTHAYNVTSGSCNSPTNVSATSPGSYAGNITNSGLVFASNFSQQWGLAGTILGYVLVLAILALIGVGGFMAYKKLKGSR